MSKLLYAGQFNIIACDLLAANGVSLDIRDQVDQITVYEDLFSPFITGNLIIIDTLDLASDMVNSGVDMLRLQIETPEMPKATQINRYFHIYKLSDRVVLNERTQSYVLHFVSSDSLTESSISISKTFRGKAEENIADILTSNPLFMKSGTPLNLDSTNNNVTYTSNYWSPVQNFTYNAEHAICSDGTPSMLFFENRQGFQFRSLVGLSTKEPIISLSANDLTTKLIPKGSMNVGDRVRDFKQDYETILTVTAPIYYDYVKDKQDGLLSSRMFSFDTTTKRLVDVTYNSASDSRVRVNPIKFYTDKVASTSYKGSNSTIKLHNDRHIKLYDGVGDTTDFAIKQRRNSIIREFQQHRIEVTLLGRMDYTVGSSIAIDINRLRGFTKDQSDVDFSDPMLSGNYVLSAICHRFVNNGKHECTFELIRDSLGKKKK